MSKSTRTPRVARRPAPHRALRRHHIAAATLAMLGAGGNAAPVTWVGADDGFWDVNSNWDAGQPGASADVQLLAFQTTLRSGNYGIRSLTGSGRLTLSGGSLSFSEASSLGSMLLSGGTLGGSGTLLVSAASEWQRGSITGSGAATFSGGLAITGTDVHDLVGRTLVLGGSSSWANSAAGNQGQVRMGNGAVLHNSGSFLDQISASTTINGNLGGAASSFSNSGTYTKTGGGVTTVQVAFNNSGLVNGTGTLALSNGGTHSGTFAMDEGGTVQLNGGTHTFSGNSAAGGAGRVLLSAGTATAGGGSMSSTGRWDLEAGTISGAGSMALNGVANWSGTAFGGGSSTSFGGALAIVGSGVHDVNAASVSFAGTTTWTNSAAGNQGQIRTGSGAALSNTGSFIDATSASTSINATLGGGASSFANSGTYRKTGASTTNITTLFNNSGTIQVDAGTLQLGGGGTGGGTIEVAPSATLEFSGGTHTVSGWTGGTGTGRVLVSGGTVNASGSNSITGRLAISGGTLNTSGSFAAGGFDMSGGTLGGTGAADIALSASSTGTWTQGTIARSGTTTFTGPLAVGGTGVHDVSGGTMALAGTTTWTNGAAGNQGQFRMGNGAVLHNSGSFLDQISASTTINGNLGGAASSFTNSGTYTKTGVGVTAVQVVFNNSGLVNGTGTLVLSNGGTHSGTFAMDEGGTVQLNGGTHTFSGNSAAGGAGRVLLSAGTATAGGGSMSSTGRWDLEAGAISGAGSMALNGVANWSGTSFGGSSSTSFGGALAIVGTGVHDVNAAGVTFAGTTTWTNGAAGNQGQIRTGSGAALSNTGTFIDATSASTSINANLGGGASSFANSGTYRKTGGSTTAISTLFNNSDTGTVQVDAGTLQLAGGGTSSGRLDVADGATLEFSGGTHAVSGLSGGTGTGRVLVSAGTVNASGSNAVTGALAISGGALNTSGSFSAGAFDMRGGTLGGSGAAAIALGAGSAGSWTNGAIARNGTTTFTGPLSVGGTGVHDVSGGVLALAGTTTWTNSAAGNQGQFRMGNGAVIQNSGSFLDQISTGTTINGGLGGGASSFSNTGTYTKTGTGTTTLEVAFNNAGLVNGSGTLVLAGGGTHSGAFAMDEGGTVLLNSGTHSFSGSSAAGGLGRVQLVDGAAATTAGPMSTTGRWDLNGGTMNGVGSFTLAGVAHWTAGTQAGTGNTRFAGALALSGNGYRDVSQRSVNFAGTTTWTNAAGGNVGRFRTGSGAVLTNSGSWLDQTVADTNFANELGGTMSRFDNTGSYSKSGGATTTFHIPFHNAAGASLQVNAGRLLLVNGGTSSGTFDVAQGATLEFGGGTHNLSGLSAGPGTGRMLVSTGLVNTTGANSFGGLLALTAGTLNVGGTLLPGIFEQTGGIVSGAGTLALNGNALWTQGSQVDAGSTTFSAALALSGNSYRDIAQRSVDFAGTTTWTNALGNNVGRFRTGNGAVLTNSGNWLDQTVADTNFANELGGAMSRFDNTGSYTKSGGATTTFYIPLNNAAGATLQVNAGRLLLPSGSSSSGVIDVASGATLEFGGGTHNLSGLSAGPGTGRMLVSTGQVNTTGANSFSGLLALTAGTLNVGGTLLPGIFEQTGGIVSGAGTLALNGNALWTQGSQTEAGSTVFSGALALSGNIYRDVHQRSINFAGTTTWTNAPGGNVGRFRTGSGAVLTNSGNWLDQTVADTNFANELGGTMSRFDNTGSYTKSGGATTTFHIPLNNAAGATLQVNAGRLLLPSGSSSSGVIDVASGATLEFGGGTHNLSGLSAGPGTGRMLVSTGQVNTTGANSFSGLLALADGRLNVGGTLAPGIFEQTGGIVSGAGTLVLNGNALWTLGSQTEAGSTVFNGALALSGNSYRDVSQRSLNFAGTTTWTNAPGNNVGRFRTGSGAVLTNSGSWLDQTVADTNFANELGGTMSRFDNTGSYTKSGGATTTFYIPFANDGTLSVSAGVLNLSGGLNNFSGSTLTGGSYQVYGPGILQFANANIVTNAATILLDGASSQLRNASNNANALANFATNTAAGRFTVQNGRNFTTLGAFNNAGVVQVGNASTFTSTGIFSNALGATLQMAGGSFAGPTVPNAGLVSGFGSVAPALDNSGTVRASGGSLTLTGGVQGSTGGVFIDTGATLVLGASGSAATLGHQGSLLALGANDVTVHQDYDNASFGVGNSFDRRAAVSGSGLILAAGLTQQTLSGALLQGGGTSSASIALPNIRVGLGGITTEFSIHNVGTGGPSLRGALQNTGIDNAGLSGSGVTAQNWGAIAQGGASAPFSITFDPSFGQALSGQTLQVVNNFDNVAGQTLTITGSAYNLASASPATPNPVVFANQREGGSLSQALSLSNLAPANGFSESLNASISGSGPVLASGSFSLLAAGSSNHTALVVGLDTSSAGAKSGTATIALASDGTGTSGFSALDIGAQTVNVSGDVYRLATASAATPNPVALANQRIGGTLTQSLSLTNTAAADGFSEGLNASIAANGSATAGGSFSVLAAGQTNNTLFVGVDTGSAGAKSGIATITLASDGNGTSGFSALDIGTQTVNVSGSVYRLASASAATPNPVLLANQRVDGTLTQSLSLTNTAAADGFSEGLNASIAANGSATAGGSFSVLAAGQTNNTLFVGVDTSSAGAKSGTATITLASDGNGTSGFSALDIGNQTVNVSGNVYRLATASAATPNPVLLGNQRVGGTLTQSLSLTNTAAADGFSEGLNASIAASGTATAGGSFSVLAAGQTNNTLFVGVDTSMAGAKSGTATITLASDGNGTSGFGALDIGTQTVNVSGSVYRLATASAATPSPVALANQRIGGTLTQSLSLTNTAAVDGFSEGLNASIAASGTATAGGSFSVLAAGQVSNALFVGVDTSSAGAKSGTATITLASDGNGTSGFSALDIGTQTVNVSGSVYRLASASAAAPNPVLLANQRLGGTLTQSLSLTNTAAADGFSEGLNASIAASGTATAGGSFSVLAAGQASNALFVGVDTSSAGAKSGTATITLASDGNGTSGFGALDIGTQTVNVSGNVYRLASASAATPNPVLLLNQRLGGGGVQTLSISNTALADGFSEGLNASIVGSGNITASGSFALLAAGATDSTSLRVGVDTSKAGGFSGTAVITLASDGTGSSGFAALDIGTQTIQVVGNTYRLASASAATPNPVQFANQRVGGTATQALSISNTAAPDGFSESLNVSIGSSGAVNAGGAVNLLAAGASSNELFVGVDTSSAGAKTGTATLTLASDGTGSSGFGALGIGSQTISVSGSVYRLASASVAAPNPVLLANQRVGGTLSQSLSIGNTAAADGYSEGLNASIAAATGDATAGGSFSVLAAGAQSNALFVGIDTTSAGAKAGTATLTLASDGAGSSGFGALGIGTQTVHVSGNVFRLAQPVADSTPIVLAARVGDAAAQRSVAVSNAGPDPFTERLNASWAAAPAGWVAAGAVNGLAQGGSSPALTLALATGSAGSFAGTAQLALVSSGAGTTEAADADLGQAAISVTGRVYAPAVAQLSSPVVNFGIVRVGEVVAPRNVALGNAASGALADTLHATLSGGGAPFAASGSAAVAAGALDETSLNVQLATTQAGVFNTTATLALSSRNGELADLALGDAPVLLQAQVNALASAGLSLVDGTASLGGGAAAFTLDFGTLAAGGGALGATLSLANLTLGTADALAGNWDLSGLGAGSSFTLSGFGSFAGLAAGSSLGGLSVSFGSGSVGHFEEVIVLRSLSTNGAGPDLALGDLSLTLQGTVVAVPEPGTWVLMVGGLLLLARRVRAAARPALAQRLAA